MCIVLMLTILWYMFSPCKNFHVLIIFSSLLVAINSSNCRCNTIWGILTALLVVASILHSLYCILTYHIFNQLYRFTVTETQFNLHLKSYIGIISFLIKIWYNFSDTDVYMNLPFLFIAIHCGDKMLICVVTRNPFLEMMFTDFLG